MKKIILAVVAVATMAGVVSAGEVRIVNGTNWRTISVREAPKGYVSNPNTWINLGPWQQISFFDDGNTYEFKGYRGSVNVYNQTPERITVPTGDKSEIRIARGLNPGYDSHIEYHQDNVDQRNRPYHGSIIGAR